MNAKRAANICRSASDAMRTTATSTDVRRPSHLCPSIGCPNLNRHAYQAELIDQQLAGAQANFLRHPRAVTLTDSGKLQVTSLFDWYLIDFAQDISGLLAYLAAQRPDLAADLSALVDEGNPKIDYVYDWDLNVVD